MWEFYRQVLTRVAETGQHLWQHLVHDIEIDSLIVTFPNVCNTEKEIRNKTKNLPNKRRAEDRRIPAVNTPISAASKKKGRKLNLGLNTDQ